MKHKGRTIGIIILCAVVVLLVINWQVQPLHRLQQKNAAPDEAYIFSMSLDGAKSVKLDAQAIKDLQESARRGVVLCVGPAHRGYMLEEGPTYDVIISQKSGDASDILTELTIDSKGFLNTQHARYHVFGTSWRDAVEKAFQQGEVIDS